VSRDGPIRWPEVRTAIFDVYYDDIAHEGDRRLLKSFVDQFLSEDVLKDAYLFIGGEGLYAIPPHGDVPSYLEYVKFLPTDTSEDVLRLHEGVGWLSRAKETKEVLGRMWTVLAPTPDEKLTEAQLADLLEMLPEIDHSDWTPGEIIGELLGMEHQRYVALLKVARGSLVELQASLQASNRSDASLSLESEVARAVVPTAWLGVCYPTCKPLASFLRDVKERVLKINKWKGEQPTLPAVWWLPAFFFPSAFITAQRQHYKRKVLTKKESLENIEVTYVFKDFYEELVQYSERLYVSSGCLIHGLVYDGAMWNAQHDEGGFLDEPSRPYHELPVLHLLPQVKGAEPDPDADFARPGSFPVPIFTCPIYNTPDRKGPELGQLSHELNQAGEVLGLMHFKLRGVVVLCQTDE
jgi:dynein heavy chain